jgi:flavin reductase (DIM6/NTAB) family NADH-FMN oxidoreductase RutF
MALLEPLQLPDDDPSADRVAFRQAFRRHPASVVVVTYIDATGAPRGMTATAMTALSADPPSLIVCIDRATRTYEAVMQVPTFAIDMLAASQRRISQHCSKPGADKRLDERWLAPHVAPGDPPRLSGAMAHLVCTIDSALDAYTHTVVVGRVRAIWLNPLNPAPLLYHDGGYRRLATITGVDEPVLAALALPDPTSDRV